MAGIAKARIEAIQRALSGNQTFPLPLVFPAIPSVERKAAVQHHHHERSLGDLEASYFLPSREDGVNDMGGHIRFTAPRNLVVYERLRLSWAILRLRHPLLASSVRMDSREDVRFCYDMPSSVDNALKAADGSLMLCVQSIDELINEHLNGPRRLSSQLLSYLTISNHESDTNSNHREAGIGQYILALKTTHFITDSTSQHQLINDFFELLGGPLSDFQLYATLQTEWDSRKTFTSSENKFALPSKMEDRLTSLPRGKLYQASSRVDFAKNQASQIGGHGLPRRTAVRRSVLSTAVFDAGKTKKMLNKCKEHGVSITSALFAICNVAWARKVKENRHLPMMLYSALDVRNLLTPDPRESSYLFLALGYFNVVLPSFLPQTCDASRIFWHRAKMAQVQSYRAAKNPMVASRVSHLAKERGERARQWAKEDDEKALGIRRPAPPLPISNPSALNNAPLKPPSTALMGVSLLGDLDRTYRHAAYPKIKLDTLQCVCRQRPGGLLMFGYTFAGKYHIVLGYDENGFEAGAVKNYWEDVMGCVDEFLG